MRQRVFVDRGSCLAYLAPAAVVGDRALWAEPPDAVKKLVPNYPLMWAMFGIARMPDEGAALRGLVHGDVISWRYDGATDTVEYVRTTGESGKLIAEVRHGGKVVGRAETTLDASGTPRAARLVVPAAQAHFAPDIWTPRKR